MSKALKYFNNDELATNVWESKYAQEGEETPDDMHKRMAKEFARIDLGYQKDEYSKEGVFNFVKTSKKLSQYGKFRKALTDDKIYQLFKNFNYVIPQGSVMSILGTNKIASLSNCVVIPDPFDSYSGIMYTDTQLTALYKRRCGVGTDISKLRPKNTKVNNVAETTSGVISFMERFSNTTREVAQNQRRGALMLTMDISHPDILDFIKSKQDTTKITGANISIKLNDKFMRAVEKDEDYILHFPCNTHFDVNNIANNLSIPYETLEVCQEGISNNRIYLKKIKAKEYWNEIVKAAHNTAEPGILNWDTMLDYSPDSVYPQYKSTSTNPCSEIAMGNDSCRLIALNLYGFINKPFTPNASFDYKKFYEITYESQRLMDNLVDLELENVDKIIEKIKNDSEPAHIKQIELDTWIKLRKTGKEGRRTGLGFTALGDVLTALGIKYGSKGSFPIIEQIMKTKMMAELDCTIDLAILRGTFKGCSVALEQPNHKQGANSFYAFIQKEFPFQAKRMFMFGRRNVSWSTVAPTGSLSMLAQVTSGIEPLFMPFYMRRKKINSNEEGVKVDFIDKNGDTFQEFSVLHEKFKDWYIQAAQYSHHPNKAKEILAGASKEDLEKIFKESPWYDATANDIPWEMRIKTQALIQKYTSHSISSTVNLPTDVSVEEVSNIYMEAWKQGVKGITVYRDGCRDGILVSKKETKIGIFQYKNSIKRPKEIEATSFTTSILGEKYSVFVGVIDNIPYEVFAYKGGTKEEKGSIIKDASKEYSFIGKEDNSRHRILTGKMTDEQEVVTRLISGSLRHGRDIKYIVKDLNETSGNLSSFNSAISRILKGFIPNGTKSFSKCNNPDCSGDGNNVVFQEGCNTCLDCGNSACS